MPFTAFYMPNLTSRLSHRGHLVTSDEPGMGSLLMWQSEPKCDTAGMWKGE